MSASAPSLRRLLLVKTSSMGDVVHALPAVTDLRAHHPGLDVDWLVEPPFAPIVALHPGVAQVHRLPWRRWRRQLGRAETWRQMSALRRALRERRYDAVIDLQGLLKSAVWARQASAPVWGYDAPSAREGLAALLYGRTARVPRQLQAVDRNRQLTALLCGMPLSGDADFGIRAPRLDPARLPGLGEPGSYAVLVPNASRPEKFWPEAEWMAVGRELAALGARPVVLWGSPAEEAMARRIADGCDALVPPFLTVAEAGSLLAGARGVVGLDTGFSHLAAALGRPVVGIYCDHEPGLAGLTGPGPLRCLGGKGQRPGLDAVLGALRDVWPAPAQPLR